MSESLSQEFLPLNLQSIARSPQLVLVQRKASGRNGGEGVDLDEQLVPGPCDFRRPFVAEEVA